MVLDARTRRPLLQRPAPGTEGRFEITGLPPGEHLVHLTTRPEGAAHHYLVRSVFEGTGPVHLTATPTDVRIRLDADPPAILRGAVPVLRRLDDPDWRPAPATAAARPEDPPQRLVLPHLGDGHYRLRFPGLTIAGHGASIDFTVPETPRLELDLRR